MYHDAFAPPECKGAVRRPIVPSDCSHNGHLYYLLFADLAHRTAVQSFLRRAGIDAVFHYVPLHSSPAGLKFGRAVGSLPVTERTAARLLRLPVWAGMTVGDVDFVAATVSQGLVETYAG
jgi:dTDP-4-amino-4,6-dideoxygalactose transaminase